MKTIDRPSGAQLPCEPLVTERESEPSRFILQTSGKPPRSVVYRICFPSGAKRGSASASFPRVSCFARRPPADMLQIFRVPLRSLTKTIVPLRPARSIGLEPGSDVIVVVGVGVGAGVGGTELVGGGVRS